LNTILLTDECMELRVKNEQIKITAVLDTHVDTVVVAGRSNKNSGTVPGFLKSYTTF
jgi:hypothetical protein